MKKFMLLLLCLFSVNIVYAHELKMKELDFYVVVRTPNSEYFVPIRKVYDNVSNEVVFNLNPSRYGLVKNFKKTDNINYFGDYKNKLDLFNKIVYLIYENDKSDLNYIFAQILIYDLVCEYEVKITDKYGNYIKYYDEFYKGYREKVLNFNLEKLLNGKEYTADLWSDLTIFYEYTNYIKKVFSENLNLNYDDKKISISANNVGNYQVNINSEDEKNYVYYYNDYYFWQFSGDYVKDSFKVNVEGVNLKIKENLIGINKRFGDSKINESYYELYSSNELKLKINDLNNNYVKKNTSYILKDKTNSVGYNIDENISFNVLESDYILEINKYVINKNINIDIQDNYTYYIYLKSNNELYEIVDKNTNLVTLPYGIYYINSNDNNYFKEIEVVNNIDDVLVIDGGIKEEKKTTSIVNDDNVESEIVNKNVLEETINVNNPKTIDNIYLYLFLFIISLEIIVIICKSYVLLK